MTINMILLLVLGVYYALGIPLGIRFILVTAPRLDPAARAASLRVRLLWLPGAVAIWPLILKRAAFLSRKQRQQAGGAA